jgi:ADP-heptose:LPS heptosyltransferase
MVLLAPGAGAGHPDVRWPIEQYAALARRLQDAGFDIVIIGSLAESGLAHAIQRQAPRARDLTGRTDFVQIAGLGARAALAIGNNLGMLHLIAAAGAPTIVLFSSDVDAAAIAPRGHVTVLHAATLKALPVESVLTASLTLARTAA